MPTKSDILGSVAPTLPSVQDLKQPTLDLLACGICNSRAMRDDLRRQFDIQEDGERRFVNNHAWALVRLQSEGRITKNAPGCYALAAAAKSTPAEPPIIPPRLGAMPAWARQKMASANRRNRERGFDLPHFTEADLVALWDRCGGRCALTGLAFHGGRFGAGKAKRAFWPSIDRIDPEVGYTRENCRLVLTAVNFALNAWGDEVFMRIARAAVDTEVSAD
jgi:hypothetical protein